MSHLDGSFRSAQSGHDPATGRFRSGNTAYRARQDRIAEKLDALRKTYDAASPGDMALLAAVAVHLADADIARSRVSRSRATNAAVRLLRQVRRKDGEVERLPTLQELLADDGGNDD